VDEAAKGIVLAAEHYNDSEAVNLGSGMEISIKDLVEVIAHLVGFEGTLRWDISKPNGQTRRALDISRAERSFGFRASMNFEEGLQRTIEWYTQQKAGSSGSIMTAGIPGTARLYAWIDLCETGDGRPVFCHRTSAFHVLSRRKSLCPKKRSVSY
jgi:hypothetical protein